MKAYLPHVKRGLVMIGANVANFALTLGRNKLLAMFFGPAGIGWIALVNNLIETAAVVGGMGVCDAFNRELPRKSPQFSQSDIVSSGIGFFALSVLFALPVATAIFMMTVDTPSGGVIAAIAFALAAGLASLWRAVGGIFLGFGLSQRMFRAIVVGGTTNLVLAVLLLYANVRELMVYVLMTPALLAVAGISGAWPHIRNLLDWQAIKTMPARKPILTIALPIVVGLVLEPVTILLLRSETAARFGQEGVGLIQPGIAFVLLTAALTNAFFGMTLVRWDQTEERAFSAKFIALLGLSVMLPICGIMAVFLLEPLWPVLIELLFTPAFVVGAGTVPWFISGEVLRTGGAMLNHTFLSRHLGYLTILPRIACLFTVAVMIFLEKIESLIDVGQTYAMAYAAYFVSSITTWLLVQFYFLRKQRKLATTHI